MVIKDFEKRCKIFGFDDRAQVNTVGNRINIFGAVVRMFSDMRPITSLRMK